MIHTLKISSIFLFFTLLLFGLLYFGGSKLLLNMEEKVFSEKDNGASVSERVGSKAPFFDLPDITSNRVRLSDFHNTPVVIFFWSTWDEGSSNQVKIFDDYLNTELVQNQSLVKVLGINSQEDGSIPTSFVRRGGYKVSTAIDSGGAITESYGVKSLPTIFFIDQEGVIREVWNGVLSVRQIVDKIEQIVR